MPAANIIKYWGKASASGQEAVAYHPLSFHCLDVAACGQKFYEERSAGYTEWVRRY